MKVTRVVLIAVMALCVAAPMAVSAAEPETQWRQRLSSRDEVAESDITEEVRFGREVAARIIGRYGMYDNPGLNRYVNLVGNVLTMSTNRPELEFHFAILNTDEINAYAAPGGYIFVTRGALLKMQNEAELAGVLAHEIGHVVEKHVVRELNIRGSDDSAVSGLARVIGGSTDAARAAFAQAVDQAMDILFKNGYKREDETQADRDSVMFCALSGYDPSGLVHYFERINSLKGKQTEVLDKTHPSYDARIGWLNDTIKKEGIDSGNYKNFKERFTEAMKQFK
jgi:predicted Zn-dependent protease